MRFPALLSLSFLPRLRGADKFVAFFVSSPSSFSLDGNFRILAYPRKFLIRTRSWEDPFGEPREANTVQLTAKSPKTAPNELGIDWGISPLEVAQWGDDDRLKEMENRVYNEGFIPNAAGF